VILQSALGLVAFCALARVMSENRPKVKLQRVLMGLRAIVDGTPAACLTGCIVGLPAF
jgi:nucleoside permease NupC